jgi:hypothetical protein
MDGNFTARLVCMLQTKNSTFYRKKIVMAILHVLSKESQKFTLQKGDYQKPNSGQMLQK